MPTVDLLPQTEPSRVEVEAALARVQQWPGLARSPQLAKFLNYIVEAKLNGNEAGIKAYSIAVDVFGRPQSFDPQNDPIVRVQARRLRAALEEYYAGEGSAETVRFYLPVGRYIPEFGVGGTDAPSEKVESVSQADVVSAQPVRASQKPLLAQLDDILLVVLLVGVLLGISLVMTQVLAPHPVRMAVPQPPKVAVAEFTSVGAGEASGASVAGLAVELVTDLGLFPFVDAVYLPRMGQGATEAVPAPYELTGIARTEGAEVQITASLKRTGFDTAVWSMTQKLLIADVPGNLDRLSEGFADQLGDLSGPLHADALQWLDAHPDFAGNETDYLCGLQFTLYRETAAPERGQNARTCVSALMRNQPSPFALAMNGTLLLDATLKSQPPSGADPEPLAEAERQISEALRLAPTLSPAWREWAFYLEAVGRFGEADAAFTSALQLNPANLDAVAGYGRLLSLRGRSEKGITLANEALRRSVAPPYWYHEAPAIDALRDGDNATALAQAELLGAGDPELASVIATVAARRLGMEEVLNRYIAQLVEVTRFRRFGILPVLRQRLGDADLRTRIGAELAAAGIDQAALNGPY